LIFKKKGRPVCQNSICKCPKYHHFYPFWTYITKVTTNTVSANQATDYINTIFGDVQISFFEGTSTTLKASTQFGNAATFGASGGPMGLFQTIIIPFLLSEKRNHQRLIP
jgi:hypothetical protein